jgi:hypothetical protein
MTGDEDDEEGAWLDEPLNGISPNPVLVLGISGDYLVEAMPFVVETANALGLTVYDTQAGECYLPSGQVLTMPGQAPVDLSKEAAPEFMYSAKQTFEIAVEHSEAFFKKYGYKLSRKSKCFIKKQDGFYHRASLNGGASASVFHSICITRGLHLVSHIPRMKLMQPEPACQIYLIHDTEILAKIWPEVSIPNGHRPETLTFDVKSVADVKSAMDKIMHYHEQTFMPLWSQMETMEDVQQFMTAPVYEALWNTVPGNDVAQLLLAYLTKADNFEELYIKLRAPLAESVVRSGNHPNVMSHLQNFEKTYELMKLEQNAV